MDISFLSSLPIVQSRIHTHTYNRTSIPKEPCIPKPHVRACFVVAIKSLRSDAFKVKLSISLGSHSDKARVLGFGVEDFRQEDVGCGLEGAKSRTVKP